MKIVKIGAMWCSGCLITNKHLKKIKEEYPSIEFIELDVDMDEEISKKYNYGKVLPEIIFYKDDVEIERLIGESVYDDIKNVIESRMM